MRLVRIIRIAVVAGPFLPVALVGCGTNMTSTSTGAQLLVSTSAAQYRAYGASITAGVTLSVPSTQAYPALVAHSEKVTFANNAISGHQACDISARQIFPNMDSPTLSTHPVYTLLVGTNDVDIKGTGAYESIFMLCDQAVIAWLAVPLEYKVLANGTHVATSGPGTIDSSNNWNAWTTRGLNSAVSFTITTTDAGPIYAWPIIDDQIPATYSYSLDGVVIGSSSVQTTTRIATQAGTTRSLGFLRIPDVPPGTHVITFTQTSTGTNGVSVVGIGTPMGPNTNNLPTVLVGTIPFQLQGATGGACTFSDAPCLKYIQDIESDVNVFTADGLNVRLFDTRKYMFGTASEMNDALHPNALGQMEISRAVEAVW